MFKMVFVVNTSLKMSPGKLASQTAHSAISLYVKGKAKQQRKVFFLLNELDVWVGEGQKKVVLKGKDESELVRLEQRADESKLLTVLIRDAGRTQVEAGSLTCLGIFGKSAEVDEITGNLTLYN
jgi:PTH2 family peptidyl-tRNA hydrolase